ncbi:unnamed protein product [Peniophora sp. CBMAI 1063]|nr:unnamed protein product [Peniophora sp. CBMAI 1063]
MSRDHTRELSSSLTNASRIPSLHPFAYAPPHAGRNTPEYIRQSTEFGETPISPPSAYYDPRVRQHSFHAYALPAPVLAGSEAYMHSQTRNDTFRSALINFAGALCLGIIAAGYASPDSLKTSRLLVTSVACGIAGCLFTLASLFLDHRRGSQCFLLLNLLSAAVGTVTMVAATQAWVMAALAGVFIVMTAGVVWRLSVQTR